MLINFVIRYLIISLLQYLYQFYLFVNEVWWQRGDIRIKFSIPLCERRRVQSSGMYMCTIIQLQHHNTNRITTVHVDQLPNSMLCCTQPEHRIKAFTFVCTHTHTDTKVTIWIAALIDCLVPLWNVDQCSVLITDNCLLRMLPLSLYPFLQSRITTPPHSIGDSNRIIT